jgi:cytosine deaminase
MTPMTRSLHLSNVRLADGQPVSVSIVDGRIAALGQHVEAQAGALAEDGGGALLLPGFVEGHTHLDKSNWGQSWYRNEVGPALTDRINNEREWRKTSGHDAATQSLALVVDPVS